MKGVDFQGGAWYYKSGQQIGQQTALWVNRLALLFLNFEKRTKAPIVAKTIAITDFQGDCSQFVESFVIAVAITKPPPRRLDAAVNRRVVGSSPTWGATLKPL